MLSLRVADKRTAAKDIHLITLQKDDAGELPPFSPGAHILVTAPNGAQRRYSLCNGPQDKNRYVIAVKREGNGGGGSISMSDDLRVEDHIDVSEPENYFSLTTGAKTNLLIAGGIGITPIISMARHLAHSKDPYKLIYCAQSPEVTAFLDEFVAGDLSSNAKLHHDFGDINRSLRFADALKVQPRGAHLYCCGPRAFMQAVRDASKHWAPGTVHFEDFGTSDFGEGPDLAFKVRLAKSERVVDVPAGMTIIQALESAGIEVPSSCQSGTCGTCRTTLLGGIADHRDFVLEEEEQAANVMICVSRSLTNELVLDL
jgi:phthalate 4,5-dioxygenase reductase subunit